MTSQRGSATVMASSLLCGLLVVAIVAGWWAGALSVRHRAGNAADLAALAGAQAWVAGGTPCPTARQVARANGADITRCLVQGPTVRVTAAASTQVSVFGRAWVLTSHRDARAGPVS